MLDQSSVGVPGGGPQCTVVLDHLTLRTKIQRRTAEPPLWTKEYWVVSFYVWTGSRTTPTPEPQATLYFCDAVKYVCDSTGFKVILLIKATPS